MTRMNSYEESIKKHLVTKYYFENEIQKLTE